VLIPRPETETLVEAALRAIRGELDADPAGRSDFGPTSSPHVLEIGTGSGAIAVALAVEIEGLRVTATDNSQSALEIAPGNARRHGVADRIAFLHGDTFDVFTQGERFDVIVSNPPYCKESEMPELQPEVRDWEPSSALVAGKDGMSVTARIIAQAPAYLVAGGWLLLEVGTQSDDVRSALEASGWCDIKAFRDLAGLVRVFAARVPQG
jgi:release factor glutamine methyltransferase